MADKNSSSTPSKPKTGKNAMQNTAADELLSKFMDLDRETEMGVEELDQFLVEQDPQFSKALASIAQDTELKAVEVEADDESTALFEETSKWAQSRGIKRVLFRLYPDSPRRAIQFKKASFRFKKNVRAAWLKFRHRSQDTVVGLRNEGWQSFKEKSHQLSLDFRSARFRFEAWPLKLKLLLFSSVVGVVAMFAVAFLAIKGKIFPNSEILFVTSMDQIGSKVYSLDTTDAFEKFYDNTRSSPQLFLVSKIVVNIKRSKNSSETPMAALDFFVETYSAETTLELRDRESWVRDLAQRSVEEFNFDELDSSAGKTQLAQVLIRELGRELKTGSIKAVRWNTFILKP